WEIIWPDAMSWNIVEHRSPLSMHFLAFNQWVLSFQLCRKCWRGDLLRLLRTNGNSCYHWYMQQRRISDQQIEEACRALLNERRRVGVRDVMHQLRASQGAVGRTARVAAILSRVMAECPAFRPPPPPLPEELDDLQSKLRLALERAIRAEEREVQHQDYWARRYAERLEELERLHATQLSSATQNASERYLRLYQWAAQLKDRLSRYEVVEPFGVEMK